MIITIRQRRLTIKNDDSNSNNNTKNNNIKIIEITTATTEVEYSEESGREDNPHHCLL